MPEWRNLDFKDFDAVIEILAKTAVFHHFFKVPVGGSDETHIHLNVFLAAHARNPALLQGPEQLGLQEQGHFADFIQQQCSAMGQFKAAPPVFNGPGKSPFHMPEEFAFKEILRDSRAVNIRKRA